MDFADQIKAISARIPSLIDNIKTEEATKQYLIIPFIQALGYDVFDPREVVPEFDADVGAARRFKLDYAILKEEKPIILIECKCLGDKLDKDARRQLFCYFAATNARIGVLTNGITYKFYADLDEANKMDENPFLEIDMQNLKEPLIDELRKITKSSFNIDQMVSTATELKYVDGIIQILTKQLSSPSEDFTKFFFSQLCSGRIFTPAMKVVFAKYTERALKQFVREQVSYSLDASGFTGGNSVLATNDSQNAFSPNPEPAQDSSEELIVTTEEELEGYYIVKSILRDVIDPSRVTHRDVQSYFGILLDNNRNKPICRLYFNSAKSKRIALFEHGSDDKQEEKFPIDSLDDIYKYSERLRSTVSHYINRVNIDNNKVEQAA